MKFLMSLIFILITLNVFPQKATRIGSAHIEHRGVFFYVEGFFDLIGNATVKSMFTFSLDRFTGGATYPEGVNYKGKHYDQSAFGNALMPFLSALQVTTINAEPRIESLECQVGFSLYNAKQGSSTTRSCRLKEGVTLQINEVIITGIGVSGLNDLFNEIDKQEAKLADAQRLKERQEVQNRTAELKKNQEVTWNTQSINNNSNSNKTQKTDAWGTPIKTGGQAPGSKQIAERTTSFDNFNQPIIKVNANGYNTEGQYVGLGKFDKTPGNINPTGPGKLRADGLYDVKDQNGNVYVISKSENQKLIIQQTDKEVTANMQARQQQQMQQFQQQQKNLQALQAANRIREQEMSIAADKIAQGIGTIANVVGSIIADGKAKREKERQRQYQLEQQRIAEFNRIKAEQDFRRNSRSLLIAEYKEGLLPLSTSKVTVDKIFYFVYSYDSTKLDQPNMPFFVSNVIEIARSGDGTWPYQRTINEEIEPLTPYKECFHGYYISEGEAEQALQTFKLILSKTGASGNEISFRKKKKETLKNSELNNYWYNTVSSEKKIDSNARLMKTTDPFWDVNSEVNNKKREPVKSETDFWEIKEPNKVAIDSTIVKIDAINISLIKTALLTSENKKAMDLFNKFPEETNDLEIESWRAHCLLLNDETAKAIIIYTKHKGKNLTTNLIPWESKIKQDIILFQSKGINHIQFSLIQSIMIL